MSIIVLVALLLFCGSAKAATVWTIGSTATGYQWVAPTGQTPTDLCKITNLNDVVQTTTDSISNGAVTKYSTLPIFSSDQSARLGALGFNSVGSDEFFPGYVTNYTNNGASFSAGELPFVVTGQFSSWMTRSSPPFGLQQVEDLSNMTGSTMICNPALGVQVDPYDPGFQPDLNTLASESCSPSCAGMELTAARTAGNLSHVLYNLPEEADSIAGFDSIHTHPDGGYIVAGGDPSNSSWAGTSDHGIHAKYNYRDFLLNEYFCTGSATPLACCTGNKTGTCTAGTGTTLSGTQLSNSLTALNTAWSLTGSTACTATPSTICNSGYTSWNTTDSGGLAGITAGTYASWGIGTGVLDENGKRLTPVGYNCNSGAGVQWDQNWAATSQILTDISGGVNRTGTNSFAYQFVNTYGEGFESAFLNHGVSPEPPIVIPVYTGPPLAYAALMPHLTNLGGAVWMSLGFFGTSSFTDMTILQNAVNAMTNPRVIMADFFMGNDLTGTDAPYPVQPSQSNDYLFHDQHTRGNAMVSFVEATLGIKDTNGKYPVIGWEHVYEYDKPAESVGNPFGLFSSGGDNPYDGALSTAATASACVANHTYTGPAICTNAGVTYGIELAHAGTCTTGASLPSGSWGLFTSGTCTMLGDGTLTHIAESAAQTGCSGHASEYGDCSAGGVIVPVANFLLGNTSWTDSNGVVRSGICDPSSAISTTQRVSGGSMF